jgi:hypothetical protein
MEKAIALRKFLMGIALRTGSEAKTNRLKPVPQRCDRNSSRRAKNPRISNTEKERRRIAENIGGSLNAL